MNINNIGDIIRCMEEEMNNLARPLGYSVKGRSQTAEKHPFLGTLVFDTTGVNFHTVTYEVTAPCGCTMIFRSMGSVFELLKELGGNHTDDTTPSSPAVTL